MGHPSWKAKTALSLNSKRWFSPLQKIAQKVEGLDVPSIEKTGAYARNPLTSPVKVLILDNKKHAADLAKKHKGMAAFVDSSLRNDLVEIGIYWQGIPWLSTADTISSVSTLTNSLGELAGIEALVAQIWNAVANYS
ncbi:hypothetical protein MMC31_000341 [Peltigera leucophlebia]|nr:hypothetical protein [Peltigera leucophlebia]